MSQIPGRVPVELIQPGISGIGIEVLEIGSVNSVGIGVGKFS
jgi:hypothetical protein